MLDTGEFVKFFAALFAIMNPLRAAPVFIALTESNTEPQKKRIALTAILAVVVTLMVTLVAGEAILDLFDISVAAFQAAGGIFILLIALSMLQAKQSPIHHSAEEAKEGAEKESPAVFPLAIPMLAGPGAIATVILYAHHAHGVPGYAVMATVIVIMAVLLYAALRAAGPLAGFLGTTGMNVVTRIMGMILAAIAVEMIAEGLGSLFPALVQG